MGNGRFYLALVMLKVVLPLIFLTCILLRQTICSLPYLILFFVLPYMPLPNSKSMTRFTGIFLRTAMVCSFINVLIQASFQIFLFVQETYYDYVDENLVSSDLLYLFGLMRFDNMDLASLTLIVSPDIIMLIASIILYLIMQKLARLSINRDRLHTTLENDSSASVPDFKFLRTKSKYIALLVLFLTSALRPSISSGLYYVVFLGGATYWACFKSLGKTFCVVCRFVSLIAALHITVLWAYQTKYFQDLLKPEDPFARYFGLTALKIVNEKDPRLVNYAELEWPSYVNPVAILILYFVLANHGSISYPVKDSQGPSEKGLKRTLSQRLSDKRLARNPTMKWRAGNRKVRGSFRDSSIIQTVFSEDTPLISSVGQTSRYRATSIGSGLKTDPHGSVYMADSDTDHIQLQSVSGKKKDLIEPTCLELTLDAVVSIFQLLVRSSYIATNIIMMAWSITYHSWLTFVLLLWASVLWMIPNQRRSMLRCSPYIVIYAEFLLLSQYIYGMNLTEEELPTVVNGVKVHQIGFSKPSELPVKPIIIKTLFAAMFWITMRQYFREKWENKQTSALSDMAAPFRVSVSTANAVSLKDERSAWVASFGLFVKKLMTKFWIWVVAISLFVIGITGNRITVFRIIYMGLFLVFILTFQISYRIWRRMMYGFWLTVIVYSMCILVLVYTYQFDNFPQYWEIYLKIPNELQLDIGLECFETTELFIRLLAPTFFVVITVVQLHYFHKDFLAISDLRNRGASVSRSAKGSSRSDGSSVQPEESMPPPSELAADDVHLLGREKISLRTLRQLSSAEIKIIINLIKQILFNIIELIILFLELHMPKIVLLSIILLCCYNVTATHFILVILCVIASLMGSKVQITVTHICSFVIAILFLLTMIYQIQYIQQDTYKWNCTNISLNDAGEFVEITFVANNSEWLGFRKATPEISLVNLLQGYIGVFAAITSHAVINTRQRIRRQETGRPKPYILFPGITREISETNIRSCLKYLINYGFYKFGVEICLMACVGVVGSRMDFYALIYAIWVLILFSLSRVTLTRIWNIFNIFIAVMIPLQYLLVIGPPPGFCIDYPWYSSLLLRRLQNWMFLPDPIQSPSAYKIVCDFILLLLISRQSLCFRIEKRHKNITYAGGSNDVIVQDYSKSDFVNPYLDHMTYTKSWLDLLKKGVFSALLWITLAVTFTAGTSRVNLFSLGYLIGSFIFLWQGNDLYLRKIENILKWWNWILGYNVLVIFLKTLLQIAGCIFLEFVQDNACWVVQLFGIGCVNKFGDFNSSPNKTGECTVPDADIGLAWDGFCFGFLLMQRRFFNSYYFFHHIDETKAMTVLQSRGAELIEELRQHQLEAQQAQERKVLEKIKRKMDRIKASQQKIYKADTFKSDRTHFSEPQAPIAVQSPGVSSSCTPRGYHTPISEEEPPRSFLQAPTPVSAVMTSLDGYLEPQRISFSSPPGSESNPRAPSPDESFPVFSPPPYGAVVASGARNVAPPPPPAHCPWISITPRHSIVSQSSHHTSIRSGDYYMFDDIDDDELDLIKEDEDESSSEVDEMDGKKRFTMSKFLSTALKMDVTKAADQALTVDDVQPIQRSFRTRRASMPASILRRKSSISRKVAPSSVFSAPTASTSFQLSTRTRHDIETPKSAPTSEIGSSKPEVGIQHGDRGDDQMSDDGIKEMGLYATPVKEKIAQKLWQSFKVLWAFFESVMVSMIRTLNKISKDYRYVVRVLAQEKRELKESSKFIEGSRAGTTKVWKPQSEILLHLQEILKPISPKGSTEDGSPDESTVPVESPKNKEDKERLNRTTLSTISESEDQEKESVASVTAYEKEQRGRTDSLLPDIRIIAPSQERGLDDDCYPYDESGTETEREEWSAANSPVWLQLLLSAWYALISHSELVCYFVIFLHQIKSPTLLSLPLPLMVFLWGSLTMPRPTKTFWITLIAYTEIVVIIKCLFQFEILPWNQTLSPENNPFYPPRIIGVEKKHSYASSDLLLLLIIFFHRYMLKSLGLWKNRYEDVITLFANNGTDRNDSNEVDKNLQLNQNINSSVKVQINEENDHPHVYGETIEDIELERHSLRSTDDEESNNGESAKESPRWELVKRGKNRIKKKFTCITVESSEPSENQKVTDAGDYEGTFDKFPNYFQEAGAQYYSTTKSFFSQLLDTGSRLSADVYAYMFICDFFNFLVVLFGFSAFGTQQGDGGVSAYLEENKVPVPFLLMMILQFALIVIDRALYLRKYILGKIIFQFVLVVGVHLWMFFVLPAITERPFNQLLPPQMWYMVKCFYLLMSAYQIRAGYPSRILGNFICKKYNYINLYSFRGFMVVPFLFELRALMDWIWTDTSMTLSDWLKMEDIFAQIFQLKCLRRVEAEYPLPRGEKKRPMSKYLLGGAGLFLIIAIIWFPLVLFALGNTVGESNLPYDVTISLRIGAYQYIYQMSAQNNTIYMYSENQFDSMTEMYKSQKNREALSFLSNYQFDDVAVVKLSGNSTVIWGISPPDQVLLLQEVESNQTISIKFRWKVSRVSNNPEMVGDVTGERQIYMPPFINGKRNPKRINLANMLKGENSTQETVVIENILPKFIKITNKGRADAISKLMNGKEDVSTYRNISIKLKTGESSIHTMQQWWEVSEMCDDENFKIILSHLPLNDCRLFITIFTFNDKAFPATLSFISGKGIIGLYVSIVFVMWTLVRGYFTGISSKIMFDDMPNVDRILQLCLDIYLVRESYEFALEEDLFAKLVFLYRSPETIIKWTREREDTDEDDDGVDGTWIRWLLDLLSFLIEFMFAFLEMHMIKIILFSIMMLCCFDVNALHSLIVMTLLLTMSLSVVMMYQAFRLIGVFLSFLLLSKLIFQTKLIPKPDNMFNCTWKNTSHHISIAFSDLKWLGYEMLMDEENIAHLWRSYFLVLLLMTFQMVVYIRQRINRIDKGKPEKIPSALYPEVTRAKADDSIENLIKFMFNYGFYKFGVEISFSTVVFVIIFRMDVMSSVYALWLLVMFALRRSKLSRVWTLFYITVVLSILWQYAMAVGLPPRICIEYPWKLREPLIHWLYLADYRNPPDGTKILADFFMLIIIWCQKKAFNIEKKSEIIDYPGGSNKEVHMEYYKPDFVNPVPNQTAINRSALDVAKNFVVISLYWLTLGFVFYTGIRSLNVLSLGYLIGSFLFLWIGYEICLWHINRILKWWNLLLAYTTVVILLKSIYELVGCAYGSVLSAVMHMDAVCFCLILFQRRLFFSYYFAHIVNDARAIFHLQSKGAEFVELLMQKKIFESRIKKKKILENIQGNMNRIKKWQEKIHLPNYMEPESHATAILMGDYYMFEKTDELDDLIDQSEEEARRQKKQKKDEVTVTQFIETMYKKTTEGSVSIHKRKEAKKSIVRQDGRDYSTDGEHSKKTAEEDVSSRSVEDKEDEKKDFGDKSKQDGKKLKSILVFLDDFINSLCVTMLTFFEKHSKDYRYINTKMKEERKFTKMGLTPSRSFIISSSDDEDIKDETLLEDGERSPFKYKRHVWVRLANSFSAFVMSQTEFFCYFTIFIHQIFSPTVISIPLPLFALLWGSLTTLRPTTTFWTVLIAYTEVTLLIKAIFQNLIFPWNKIQDIKNHPYDLPLVLGIHKEKNYATADLFLLLILFVHRYKLKRLGLWKKSNEEETLFPQNYGVYSEISSGDDDEHDDHFDLKNEANKSSPDFPTENQPKSHKRLAKWKCTSKAMAAYKKPGQSKQQISVALREIEGEILVTYKGRRLKPKFMTLTMAQSPPTEVLNDIILRVYKPGEFRKPSIAAIKLSFFQHFTPPIKFFIQIIDQKGRLSADFYTLIFFFDFLSFLLVFVGFQYFTQVRYGSKEENFYLAEEHVSGTYLVTVLLHFLMLIVDRVLYLKKNVIGKLILQIIQVLIVHIWMFLILPKTMEISFTELIVPQIYYVLKCLYFLMSSYQMRAGYPLRVQGHFLCRRYTYINYLFYKGLQFIPFFNQLRIILDYCCIQSSLSIMEWIKMESMFQVIFETKCLRRSAERYPTPRGIIFPKFKKYVPGMLTLLFLIIIIWFPYFLFAIFETVSEANLPKMGVLDLTIGSFGKMYRATASYESIIPFKYSDFDMLKSIYKGNKKVWSFLANYKYEDVAVLKFPFQPMESWKIRPDEFKKLNRTIQEQKVALKLYVSWKIYRTERAQIVATASGGKIVKLPRSGVVRDEFARAFRGENNSVFMQYVLPKFIEVNNEGNAVPEAGFFSPRNLENSYRNVTMRLLISEDGINAKLWEITELADDELENSTIARIPHQDYEHITIFTFNQKNIPKSLLHISRRGIIGLYISIVFVMWMVVKRFMNIYPVLQFTDMPNVDRMLQLCNDIYVARESHEFALEEDLFAKLLFLFRSSETLIKWTKLRTRKKNSDLNETSSL